MWGINNITIGESRIIQNFKRRIIIVLCFKWFNFVVVIFFLLKLNNNIVAHNILVLFIIIM